MSDAEIIPFDPRPRVDEPERRIMYCANCGSRRFKLVRYSDSEPGQIECAECEWLMKSLTVSFADDP